MYKSPKQDIEVGNYNQDYHRWLLAAGTRESFVNDRKVGRKTLLLGVSWKRANL